MLLGFRLIVNTNYSDSIRMALLPLIIIIPLKTISQLLYVMLEIITSEKIHRVLEQFKGHLEDFKQFNSI